MDAVQIGISSVALIVILIYFGLYIPVALGFVSFLGVLIMKGNITLPINLLSLAVADTISHSVFATIPLFSLMGLLVSKSGLGKDVYEVANFFFYKVRGGLGIATVAANAIFAAITGSSIASASVFTKVSVPEMRRFNYTAMFSVGVVAGSSVLGMLIPPSAMLIIYSIVAEQSVGDMFIAGIVPGIILTIAYCILIVLMSYVAPKFIGGTGVEIPEEEWESFTFLGVTKKIFPILVLIMVVLGGIYSGIVTAVEAGAAGSIVALIIALIKRSIDWRGLWEVLMDTGHITASILFLIISASMYSRMLGVAGLPTLFGEWLVGQEMTVALLMTMVVVMFVLLGTVIDTASMILIVVPLFLPVLDELDLSMVWFGIIAVISAEIGLLTPPLGISVFVIKSTLDDKSITLFEIFAGAFPFAVTMLLVVILLIAFPELSTYLVDNNPTTEFLEYLGILTPEQ
jgi:tripartite ATP-independent transporter DctM subunit